MLIDGQSNSVANDYHAEALGDLERNTFVRSYGSSVNDGNVVWDREFGIAVANSPYVHAAIGQWGLRMANRVSEEASLPILVINGAVGGTSVWEHQRNDADPTDVDTIYGRMLWRAQRRESPMPFARLSGTRASQMEPVRMMTICGAGPPCTTVGWSTIQTWMGCATYGFVIATVRHGTGTSIATCPTS